MNSGSSSGDIKEAGLWGHPRGLVLDYIEDIDSWDWVVTALWCWLVSPGVSFLLVIAVSRLSSGFGDTSYGSPPPNRLENILILTQVPEEILILCKGGGLTKTSTLLFHCEVLYVKALLKTEKKEVVF
jgi:hypothetical protein